MTNFLSSGFEKPYTGTGIKKRSKIGIDRKSQHLLMKTAAVRVSNITGGDPRERLSSSPKGNSKEEWRQEPQRS